MMWMVQLHKIGRRSLIALALASLGLSVSCGGTLLGSVGAGSGPYPEFPGSDDEQLTSPDRPTNLVVQLDGFWNTPLEGFALISGARLLPYPELRSGVHYEWGFMPIMFEHDLTGGVSLGMRPLAAGMRHGVFLVSDSNLRVGVSLFAELIHPDMIEKPTYDRFGNWFAGGTVNVGYRWSLDN